MRWWSSSTNTCGFCTVLLSRTTSPCLFLHRFLSPSLLSSQEFFCQHMSFSLRVSDEHIGPISTAEEPHFNAQVRNRSIAMLLYCVAIHFMDLLMWYAYLRRQRTQLGRGNVSWRYFSCSRSLHCLWFNRTVPVKAREGLNSRTPGKEGKHMVTLWLLWFNIN